MVDVVAGKGHDEEEKLFAGDEEVLIDPPFFLGQKCRLGNLRLTYE